MSPKYKLHIIHLLKLFNSFTAKKPSSTSRI